MYYSHSCSFCAVVLFFLRKLDGRNMSLFFPDLSDPLNSPRDSLVSGKEERRCTVR